MENDPLLSAWQRHSAAAFGFASRAGRRMKLGLAEVAALELVQTLGPLTPGQIGAQLAMPSGSVTALIDRLEAKRFVERKPNPKDRRGYLIVLSPQAWDRAGLDLLPMAERIAKLAAQLPAGDRAVVAAFLDRLSVLLSDAARR
ncbi:MAG: MarR family transcriptional regulator [Rhodobacterales bacterium]|nr:MarR family transcriptional regulator [Rhodobacterales bacterium]